MMREVTRENRDNLCGQMSRRPTAATNFNKAFNAFFNEIARYTRVCLIKLGGLKKQLWQDKEFA
jgi:hypothetical protein